MVLAFGALEQGGNGRSVKVFHGAAEQNDQALDENEGFRRDIWFFQRQIKTTLYQRAEQHGRQKDADRMLAPHQGDGDADEAGATDEVERQIMRRTHDGIDGAEARQRAGDQHDDDDHLADRHARIVGRMLVEARGAQLEAPRRSPDHHAVDDQGGNRQNKTDVQRRVAQGWEPGGEARHFAAFRKHAAGRVLLARRYQVLHDNEVHQAGGDEVEHDGGDHDMAAALGLQIAGQEAP